MEYASIKKEVGDSCLTMKRLVIVKPGCREFGNELLNHISIYAYGLELGVPVADHSAYGYPRFLKILHVLYARLIGYRYAVCSLRAWKDLVYLPPTKSLKRIPACDTLYFFGWLFRNPKGLAQYRSEIIAAFAPRQKIQKKIDDLVAPLRDRKTLIGVHIRQQPYAGFEEGDFLISPSRVRHIVDEYIREKNMREEEVSVLLISDRDTSLNTFDSYKNFFMQGDETFTLYLLSKCDVIIGTNSTFSNTAAWFGNIPHIVTSEESLDWDYYRNKTVYFENKYATFTH